MRKNENYGVDNRLIILCCKTLGTSCHHLIVNVHTSNLLETKYPDIYHSCDVWHKAKKLKKALAEV